MPDTEENRGAKRRIVLHSAFSTREGEKLGWFPPVEKSEKNSHVHSARPGSRYSRVRHFRLRFRRSQVSRAFPALILAPSAHSPRASLGFHDSVRSRDRSDGDGGDKLGGSIEDDAREVMRRAWRSTARTRAKGGHFRLRSRPQTRPKRGKRPPEVGAELQRSEVQVHTSASPLTWQPSVACIQQARSKTTGTERERKES